MRKIFPIIALVAFVAGCSKLHPYQVDVIQGNLIDASKASELHLGMTKSEVNSLLGTPVLIDTFEANTWIYAFTKQVNGGKITKKKLILQFKNNRLSQIQ